MPFIDRRVLARERIRGFRKVENIKDRGLVGGASELLREVFNPFGRPLVFWKGLVEICFTCSREILFLDPKSIFRHGMGNRA